MSPYAILGSRVGTAEAASLCVRLTTWHDAMVAHERRLRTSRTFDACDDECPHVEAQTLWTEALATLGAIAASSDSCGHARLKLYRRCRQESRLLLGPPTARRARSARDRSHGLAQLCARQSLLQMAQEHSEP